MWVHIGSVIMKATLKSLVEFRALTKSVFVVLCSVVTILPVFSQSAIDTIRNDCKGSYSLSARSILNGLNINSLRVSNLYQANFNNWNTWNNDYALSFWVEIGEGLDAQLLLNNSGFGGGNTGHSIYVKSDSISLNVQNGGLIKSSIQTGWNQVGLWVKEFGISNNVVLFLNGVAVDSVLSLNKYDGFQFGSTNAKKRFDFNIDDIILFVDSLNRSDFIDLANRCITDSIQSNVTNYYNFEDYDAGQIVGNFKNIINNQYDFQGTNYSSTSIVNSAPNCGNYPIVLWSTGDSSWKINSPAGSTISCSINYMGQFNTQSIILPNIQSYQNLVDLFPDTIKQFGNTIDTIVNWMNWPPDTLIVQGAGIEYIMPNNDWSNISISNSEISNYCTISNQKVTFRKSGFYKFNKNYWGSGFGSGCWEEEVVFIYILDSLRIIDVNPPCDTNSLFVSAKIEDNTHLSPNYIQDRSVSEYSNLDEFTLYMRHYPTGTINGKSQYLAIFPNLLELKLLTNNHLRVYSGLDSLTTPDALSLNEWQSLAISLTGEELSIYINGLFIGTVPCSDQILPPLNGGIDFGSASWLWPLSGFYGYTNSSKYDFYKGAYSEISTWRRALDPTEIRNLDNFLNPEDNDLIGLYTFGGGYDVHDYSHNMNNLYFSSVGVLPLQTADKSRNVWNGNLIAWDKIIAPDFSLSKARPISDTIFSFLNSNFLSQYKSVQNLSVDKNTIKGSYLSCDLQVIPDVLDSNSLYVWSQDGIIDTTFIYSPIDTGSFTLTVYKDSCSRSFDSRINLFDKPNYSIIATNPTCEGTFSGKIDIISDSSIIVYIDSVFAPTATVDSLGQGSHFVEVISSSGCSFYDTIDLIDPPTFSVQISQSIPSCYGSSDGQIHISLYGGVNPYASFVDTALSGLYNSNLDEGVYQVIVGDSSTTCKVDTISIHLNGPPPFTNNLINAAYMTCVGQPLLLSPNTDSNFNYVLLNQGSVIDSGVTFTISDTGFFILREYLSDSCFQDNHFTHLKYPDIYLTTSIQNPSCIGSLTGSIALILDTNTFVQWHDGDTGTTRSNLGAGVYKFTLTNLNGCTRTDSVSIFDPLPRITTYAKSDISCYGADDGVISISSFGGIGTPSIHWLQTGVSGFSPSGLSAGTYSFYITDSSSCIIDTFNVDIFSPDSLVVNILYQENVLCHGNQSGKLDFSYSGGANLGSASLKNLQLQTSVTQTVIRDSVSTFTNLLAGSYLLEIIDSSGCTDSTVIFINQPSAPFSVVSSTFNASKCIGDSSGSISISVSGGVPPYSINWNIPGLSGFNLGNLPDGIYSAVMRDSNNCEITASYNLSTTQITPATTNPSICMITFDYSSQKNKVIWECPVKQGIDTFYIYRNDFGSWNNVGRRAAEDSTFFLDLTSSPLNKTHEYSIVLKDSCGFVWGAVSNNTHTTSLLQSSMGTNGQVNLSWTNYIGATVSYFRILRKVSNGGFVKIDSVNSTAFTYVDNSPPVGILEYMVEAVLPINCSINPIADLNFLESSSTQINSIRSNSISETTIGIFENHTGSVMVYPNPNNGLFKVEILDPSVEYIFRFVDLSGKLIKEGEISALDPNFIMENIPRGVYYLILVTMSDLEVIKVVVQ